MISSHNHSLDNYNVDESVAYDNEDMIAYVSVTGFLAMTIILLLVLSV